MKLLASLRSIASALFYRTRIEVEMDKELRSHIQNRAEDLERSGLPHAEAGRRARLEFGSYDKFKEEIRETLGTHFIEILVQDLRFGLRMLRKSPGFTAVAVLTLALGIGANTAIFSVFDCIVWHALPVPDFGRLVLVDEYRKGARTLEGVSAADFLDWQQAQSFDQLAAYKNDSFKLAGNGLIERIDGAAITPNFFLTLGVRPLIGRSFLQEEAEPGHSHAVILSYGFWQSHFGSRPDVLGQSIELDGSAYTVVGVMPRGLSFPTVDLWVPLAFTPTEQSSRSQRNLSALARLKPYVSYAQAESEITTIETRVAETHPATNKDQLVYFRSLRVYLNGNLTYYWGAMFMGAMGFVLLIACANVAVLQFARGSARLKEIGVRAALGASRRRIVRQLLTENALLALLSAGLGLLFANWGVRLVRASMPADVARLISGWNEMQINQDALAFTIFVAALSAIFSGLGPALQSSKVDLNETLKEGGNSTLSRSRHRLQSVLVAGQVGLALVLLVAGGLFVRGVHEFASQQKRYAPSGVMMLRTELPQPRYSSPGRRQAFYEQTLDKLRALPGAQSAAVFSTIPFSNNGGTWTSFDLEGHPAEGGQFLSAQLQSVSPGFFSMLQIPLLEGRDFDLQDGHATLAAAIISKNLADRFWPHESPVGRHIRLMREGSTGPWLTVVGVVGDVVWDWTDNQPEYAIFQPFTQAPLVRSFVAVRAAVPPESLITAARDAMAGIDPDLPALSPETLEQAMHDSFAGIPLLAGTMASLGFIAFVLAFVGIYSLIAYSVTQRTREIGLRMTLGATREDISRMFLRRGACLAGAGLAAGLPASFFLARLLGGLIFGVSATDPLTFGGTAFLLMLMTLAACYIPARRAMRVDPMAALRYE